MTTIRFHVSEAGIKGLTLDDYEAMERAQDGDVKMYRLRPLIANFVVDEEGKPVELKAALQQLGKLTMDQVADVLQGFFEAMKEQAIPKGSGNSSSSVSTQADGSPAGSAPS
jgi:hypothetical protein